MKPRIRILKNRFSHERSQGKVHRQQYSSFTLYVTVAATVFFRLLLPEFSMPLSVSIRPPSEALSLSNGAKEDVFVVDNR
jgi:hypothetical protein